MQRKRGIRIAHCLTTRKHEHRVGLFEAFLAKKKFSFWFRYDSIFVSSFRPNLQHRDLLVHRERSHVTRRKSLYFASISRRVACTSNRIRRAMTAAAISMQLLNAMALMTEFHALHAINIFFFSHSRWKSSDFSPFFRLDSHSFMFSKRTQPICIHSLEVIDDFSLLTAHFPPSIPPLCCAAIKETALFT